MNRRVREYRCNHIGCNRTVSVKDSNSWQKVYKQNPITDNPMFKILLTYCPDHHIRGV